MSHYRPLDLNFKSNSKDKDDEKKDKDDENKPTPPGAPDRTPVEEPDEKQIPLGDPQIPSKKKTPKLLAVVVLTIASNFMVAQAQVRPAPTLGQPSYPSSGSTRNRGNVMGGEASTTKTSNFDGPTVPFENPSPEPQEQESSDESFNLGPYSKDGEYQFILPEDKE